MPKRLTLELLLEIYYVIVSVTIHLRMNYVILMILYHDSINH